VKFSKLDSAVGLNTDYTTGEQMMPADKDRLLMATVWFVSYYDTDIVLITLGITAAVCLAISIFAVQTKVRLSRAHKHDNTTIYYDS